MAAALVSPAFAPPADHLVGEASTTRDGGIDGLLSELRSDPERRPGEPREEWYSRALRARLTAADKVLAHPDAAKEHQDEVIAGKLAALDGLSRRDPDGFEKSWREFAASVVAKHPGNVLARDAEYLTLSRRIGDDPADPTLAAEIERFAKVYPDSGGHAYQLFVRLAGSLYGRDPQLAFGVLDGAARALPPELAATLRRYRNALAMVGGRLETPWPRLDGQPFRLEELRGKVVLIYSWATWCGPCIEKFPMLNEIRAACHDQGFEIVAVSYDDDPADVVAFLRDRELPWVHVMRSEKFQETYGEMGTPGSILVGRDGIVVGRSLFGREEIESAVRRALREKMDGAAGTAPHRPD